MPELEKEVKQWKAKLKSFDAIEDLRHKLTDLKNDMAWAIVIGKGKVLMLIQMLSAEIYKCLHKTRSTNYLRTVKL